MAGERKRRSGGLLSEGALGLGGKKCEALRRGGDVRAGAVMRRVEAQVVVEVNC